MATFRTMHSLDEAQALASNLEHLGFNVELARDEVPTGEAIMGTGMVIYRVKLDPGEFMRAENALESDGTGLSDIPPDHYLLDYTDQELMDVVMKIEEWGPDDRRWARMILSDRGKPMSDELIASVRQQRLDDLARPASPQHAFIVLGYVSSLLGGLMGVAIGYHLNTAKKILPNGGRVYVYRPEDRKQGKRIFFLGLAIFIPLVIIRASMWFMGE